VASIFTKIIDGQLPCHKIAESSDFMAFLDINPIKLGHTLVIPKKEIDYVFDLDDDEFQGIMAFAKSLALPIKQATSCERVCMIIAGYEVPHTHIHLVPTDSMMDLSFSRAQSANDEQLGLMANKIRNWLITG
tara:strand:+ start:396 stop:794 length:399 start_codon:yes stop_codon:yes gene_type:complete